MGETLKKKIEMLIERGYSQAKIAKLCDISSAALSNYLSGKYEAKDLTSIEEKIWSGIIIELDRLDKNNDVELTYIETKASKTVENIALICHVRRRMGLVYGGAGRGKTRPCKEYARRNKNTLYVKARPSLTARMLVIKIASLLGCDTKGSQYNIEEDIILKLKGSGKLIIVDECEHLDHRSLETLRTVIYDEAGCGLLLVGLESLKFALIGHKGKNEYLSSRCLVNHKITDLTLKDTENVVKKLFKTASDSVVKTFHDETEGNMRLLENTVFEVKRLMKINKQESVTKDMIRFAAGMAVLK